MTALGRKIAAAEAADRTPAATPWGRYSRLAAVVGCSSQSVYLWHRRAGVDPLARLPANCRNCGRRLVGGVAGFCRDCCVRWGGLNR